MRAERLGPISTSPSFFAGVMIPSESELDPPRELGVRLESKLGASEESMASSLMAC
jgi:hypothetical protein